MGITMDHNKHILQIKQNKMDFNNFIANVMKGMLCSHKVIRVPREAADRGTEKEARERRQGVTGVSTGRQRNEEKEGQMAIGEASQRSSPTERQEANRETRKAAGYPALNGSDS